MRPSMKYKTLYVRPMASAVVLFLDSPKTGSPDLQQPQQYKSAYFMKLPDAYAPLNAYHISGLGKLNLPVSVAISKCFFTASLNRMH